MPKKNTPAAPAIQGTLELPYAPIEKVASRQVMRDLASDKKTAYGRQTYFIPLAFITIRAGFNGRIKPAAMSEEEWEKELGIEELAMDLLENGHQDPIKGDLSENGKVFWLTDGERRFRAIRWLHKNKYKQYKNGKDIKMVEVILNPSTTTEEDRLLLMLATDSKKKYNAIETGHMFLRLKNHFKYSHEAIAKKKGLSRQTVDNLIKLAEEPQAIQEAILTGKFGTTAAIELINKEKDPVKRLELFHATIGQGHELKVKDIGKTAKYRDYTGLMAAAQEMYDEGVITFDKAKQDIDEICVNARLALPAETKDIDTARDNAIEALQAIYDGRVEPPAAITYDSRKDEEGEEEEETEAPIITQCREEMRITVDRYNTGVLDYPGAIKALGQTHAMYTVNNSAHAERIQEMFDDWTERIDNLKEQKDARKVKKVETSAAIDEEEKSRKTSSTFTEPSRPKAQKEDALAPIDFAKDKELGELELNEIIKLHDKLQTKINLFPANMKQYKDDCIGLSNVIQHKLTAMLDILKKAPERGE